MVDSTVNSHLFILLLFYLNMYQHNEQYVVVRQELCVYCVRPRDDPRPDTPPSPFCAAVLHFTYPIQVDHSAILVCTSDALNKGFSSFFSVLSRLAVDNGILLFSNTSGQQYVKRIHRPLPVQYVKCVTSLA